MQPAALALRADRLVVSETEVKDLRLVRTAGVADMTAVRIAIKINYLALIHKRATHVG